MFAKQNNRRGCTRQCIKAIALVVSLVLSALLMAMAVGSAAYSWLAWFGLLPFFFSIRVLRPKVAALAGAFWGICFYCFSASGVAGVISPTLQSLALLIIVPAFYACFGALLTSRLSFNPLLLALGWIAVEFALKPLGLRQGLLAGTQTNPHLHLVGRLLGYVFVAFLVACVNASLLAVLSITCLRFPCRNLSGVSPLSEFCYLFNTSLYSLLITIFRGYPRPPPFSSNLLM